MTDIKMWHGSKRWDGNPEVRPPRKGRYEAGPGIYLTTSYFRAKSYAKGGGSTMLITLDPNLIFANQVPIPVDEAIKFIREVPRMKKKNQIVEDIKNNATRSNKDWISAEVIVNLFVNHEAGAGEPGVILANWLRSRGVDATLHHESTKEEWIVVIDPSVIRSVKRISANEIDPADYDLPLISVREDAGPLNGLAPGQSSQLTAPDSEAMSSKLGNSVRPKYVTRDGDIPNHPKKGPDPKKVFGLTPRKVRKPS